MIEELMSQYIIFDSGNSQFSPKNASALTAETSYFVFRCIRIILIAKAQVHAGCPC